MREHYHTHERMDMTWSEGVPVSHEQVTAAIIDTLSNSEYWHDLDPVDINNGQCEDFAMAVVASLDFPVNLLAALPRPLCDEDLPYWGHCWIELIDYDGTRYYFDAELPEGTDNLDCIPYFREGR